MNIKSIFTPRFWGALALFVTAMIWGLSFVAQSQANQVMPPFAFNGIRSLIGCLMVTPVFLIMDAINAHHNGFLGVKTERKKLFLGGVCCGFLLCTAISLQQWALLRASTGKAGFLTALYIVMVPVIIAIFKKKIALHLWIASVLALFGMYLQCFSADGSGMNGSDFALLGCAFTCALHIFAVDYYACRTDPIRLSGLQFLVASLMSLILSLASGEKLHLLQLKKAALPILYCGVGSTSIGYTLQVVGQKYAHPVTATVLMSLESVFAAIGGWLILHQTLSTKELCGCIIIFTAVILAQIPQKENA